MNEQNEKDQNVLLSEYQAAVAGFHHYDSFRWQAGSLIIAGSLVVWGLLLSDSSTPKAIGITSIFITSLLSAWIFFAHHYRQLYMTKAHRIHEIEKALGMKLNIRLGFLGEGDIKYPIHGFKGHNLDIFIYIVISIFGPVLSWLEATCFSYWLLSPIPIIAFTVWKVKANERKMRKHYGEWKEDPSPALAADS